MTRLFTDGAEFGDNLFFELGDAEITSSYPRSGVYAYAVQQYGSIGAYAEKLLPSTESDIYVRFGSRVNDIIPTSNYYLFEAKNGGNTVVRFAFNSSRLMYITVGETIVDTGDRAYVPEVYHLIDIHIEVGAAGVIEVKYDGILELYYSGDTRGNSQTVIDRLWWGSGYELGDYPRSFVDDIACNNTDGLFDNFWCGDGHVELLKPNANGDQSDWIGNDGNKIDNYLLVDETPPDEDTTYVGTLYSSQIDAYNLSNYVATGKLVRRVWAEARAKDMSAMEQSIRLGYKTHGTVYLSADRVLTYNYTREAGDAALVNPSTSGIWTESELDDLQFVVESGTIVG